jgi:phosphoglycolate phosphatase/putative hydrolase of the HAD superfamily
VKVFGIPERLKAIIFDMDGTLYTNLPYVRQHEESQVRRLAMHWGLGIPEVERRLADARAIRERQGLPKTSMANIFLSFGIDMETIVRWRNEEIDPFNWLSPDSDLDDTLERLAKRFDLALLTNNPRRVGEKSLEALGVRARFKLVVGLDDSYESKPKLEPFLKLCEVLGVDPQYCLSIGDRQDVDIAPALALGMGGILVDGVSDVYKLPDFLIPHA